MISYGLPINISSLMMSSTESEDSSDDEVKVIPSKDDQHDHNSPTTEKSITFQRLFPTMKSAYGVDIRAPHKNDIIMYKRYTRMATSSNPNLYKISPTTKYLMLVQHSAFTIDNTMQVTTPYVAKSSLDVYINYVYKGRKLSKSISSSDVQLYRRYAGSPSV